MSELVAGSTLTCTPVLIRKFYLEIRSWIKSEFSFVLAAMVATDSQPGHFPLWQRNKVFNTVSPHPQNAGGNNKCLVFLCLMCWCGLTSSQLWFCNCNDAGHGWPGCWDCWQPRVNLPVIGDFGLGEDCADVSQQLLHEYLSEQET